MMALETVVYPQDTFSYVCRDFCSYGGGTWGTYDYGFQLEEQKAFLGVIENQTEDQKFTANWEASPEECSINQPLPGGPIYPPVEVEPTPPPPPQPTTGRRKRRRTRSTKNKEEIENQRMTHIAVERNRRKQMNEYLAVLRSLMPSSYVQRVSFLLSHKKTKVKKREKKKKRKKGREIIMIMTKGTAQKSLISKKNRVSRNFILFSTF